MDLVPPLLIAVPFAVAGLLMAFSRSIPRRVADVTALASAAAVAAAAGWLLTSYPRPVIHWFGGWMPRGGTVVGIDFFADLIGSGLACFAAIIVFTALLVSWRYFDTVGALYHALMLVLLGALAGFCLTGDLFNLFVFYELVGVASYALTAYKIEEAGPLQGSMNFAVVVTVGASFLLTGVALLYGRTGVLNMVEMGGILAEQPADGLVVVAFVLVSAGLMVKSAILPFHFAHADAHAVAPTPVLVVFSGFLIYIGLYGLARLYWTIFAGAFAASAEDLQMIFMAAGTATALVGGCMAFLQSHLKRLLAFVSISHSGLMLIGFGFLSAPSLAGVFAYLVAHGAALAALFVLLGVLLHRFGEVHEHKLHGRARSLRWTGALVALGALAVTGVPPFGTFAAKSIIEHEAHAAGMGWITYVFMIASALSGAAILRAAARVFCGWGEIDVGDQEEDGQRENPQEETSGNPESAPRIMVIPAAGLLLLCAALGIGLYPLEVLHSAAEAFVDPEFYLQTLFGAEPEPAPPPRPVEFDIGTALAKTCVTLLLALAMAALDLFTSRLPEGMRRPIVLFGKPFRLLRRWHSGHVGDYVLWMTVGIAAFGAAALAMHFAA